MSTQYSEIPKRFPVEPRWDREIGLDMTKQPKWNIPDIVIIEAAVVGHPIKRATNPHHPYTPDEIRKEAIECIEAGASAVHFHARTDEGDPEGDTSEYIEKLRLIIDPIREKYGDNIVIGGCNVLPTFKEEEALIKTGLFETSPANAYYWNHSKLLQAETRMMQEYGVKPQIALNGDSDLNRAKQWLIDPGIPEKPLYWIYLPSYTTGSTPMPNEFAMVESLMWQIRRIREIDPASVIMICGSGRASSYLATTAMLLGVHVRVGMEDTIYRWPHKDDKLDSNVRVVAEMVGIAKALGRRPATANEFRALVGLPTR
ncbi:MAG: 3-keto-5-aminohexanoate cleavage protein [Chloroflexi bacterium]|nr:3-keto-5-aminohexanoate cleavage protein [Chloroflexota bacterium]